MDEYCYSQLSMQKSIRLLQLLPGNETNDVQCDLFEYSLDESSKPSHPYEALSYVWGSENKPQSITVNNQHLHVTRNLYTALLRLRDHRLPRVLWIDAICIDQKSQKEKETQLPLIVEIYANSRQVLLWLGEAEDDSDQALEEIRFAADSGGQEARLMTESTRAAIKLLLKRQWFQRIWVLQEMAAARQLLLICGLVELDRYAFCLGLYHLCSSMNIVLPQVTFLMCRAIVPAKRLSGTYKRLSLEICHLGELLDMYHTHQATERHDMVYALLSMCSDDPSAAGLNPDYTVRWETLMQRVVKFLLGDVVFVTTWEDQERAFIEAEGCVVGKISGVEVSLGGKQAVEATLKNTSTQMELSEIGSARWTLPVSAKAIQEGDIICLLGESPRLAIIRLRDEHFSVVMIAAAPPEQLETGNTINWQQLQAASVTRTFPLLWDWKISSEQFQNSEKYEDFIQTNKVQLEEHIGLEYELSTATRKWCTALVLGDTGEHENAEAILRIAVEGDGGYEQVLRKEHRGTLDCQYGLAPLGWAASCGCDAVVDMLLMNPNVDINLKDNQYGRTPLSWAARNGHSAVVNKLLSISVANINSKDKHGKTPLSWASENGHSETVKRLLNVQEVDVDSKDKHDQTPLSYAAENGHECILKMLIATGNVDVNTKDKFGRTPLLYASVKDCEAAVKLLLQNNADFNARDTYGNTPLSYATWYGYKTIIRMLCDNAYVSSVYYQNCQKRLKYACKFGHKAVVKLLLETGQVEADRIDRNGRTPLSRAATNGHEGLVKLLLETGQVEADRIDTGGRTPLSRAAENGHEGVVKVLLETGKVDVNHMNIHGQTPLLLAASNGHEGVVRLLLETGQVEADSKDRYDQTPLLLAASNGHEGVVRLLLETGQVEADSKGRYDQTPLSLAARNGDEGVVRLLEAFMSV